jgi:hypothetical protein
MIDTCPLHKDYDGKKEPTQSCENCWSVWAMRHAASIGPKLAQFHAQVLGKEVNPQPRAGRGVAAGRTGIHH